MFSVSREEHLSKEPSFCLTGFSYLRAISRHVRSLNAKKRRRPARRRNKKPRREEGSGAARKRELLWTFFRGREAQWISPLFSSPLLRLLCFGPKMKEKMQD